MQDVQKGCATNLLAGATMKTLSTQEIDKIAAEKSTDELLAVIAEPDDWQPYMLEAAKAQLQRRGVEFSAPIAKAVAGEADFDELQRAANYIALRKKLRVRGIGSILWGVIAIVLGIVAMDTDPVNVILAVIGAFLTIEGIWLVAAPAPAGMIADGIGLVAVGIWNLAITFMSGSSSNDSMPFFGFLGVMQIVWGCQSFGKYSLLSKLSHAKPSADTLQKFDRVVNYLEQANMMSDASLIEFIGNEKAKRPITWKGLLGEASAVFVAQSDRNLSLDSQGANRDFIYAAKQDVSFKSNGQVLTGNILKVKFSIKDRMFSGVGARAFAGTMSPEAFQRYEAWKTGRLGRPLT
jgi:hypothetical protein